MGNHLSRNFTDKLWASLDARYQYGGTLKADGVSQDNTINAVAAGFTAGYQILPPLGFNVAYSSVLGDGDNVQANMVKLTLVFSYVDMKKLE